jgi:hypothetical protein
MSTRVPTAFSQERARLESLFDHDDDDRNVAADAETRRQLADLLLVRAVQLKERHDNDDEGSDGVGDDRAEAETLVAQARALLLQAEELAGVDGEAVAFLREQRDADDFDALVHTISDTQARSIPLDEIAFGPPYGDAESDD